MPRLLIWLYLLAAAAVCAEPETSPHPISLPKPDGEFSVGTRVWHWIDRNRTADNNSAPRELMAQLWYPSDTKNDPTAYRPLTGGRYQHVAQHAVGGAPFTNRLQKATVIALCPGRGTSAGFYTALAEALASHGFAVLALDSPGLGYVAYPDERISDTSDTFRPGFELITGPYEKVDAFFEPAVETGLTDWRFALRELKKINQNDPARALRKKLDLSRMGAFGHSLGGRICGALAHETRSIVAYAAMEGVPPRQARRGGLNAAAMMLYSSQLPEDMALPNIREVYDFRKHPAVILRLEGFGHNSVSDRVLISPQAFDYPIAPGRGIDITRHLLLGFFDNYLRKNSARFTDALRLPELTVIEAGKKK